MGTFIGFGVIVYETAFDHADRPWLYAAALAATGIPIGRAAEDFLGKFTGQGAGADDPLGPTPTVPPKEKE